MDFSRASLAGADAAGAVAEAAVLVVVAVVEDLEGLAEADLEGAGLGEAGRD